MRIRVSRKRIRYATKVILDGKGNKSRIIIRDEGIGNSIYLQI